MDERELPHENELLPAEGPMAPDAVYVRARHLEAPPDTPRSRLVTFGVGLLLLAGVLALFVLTLTPSIGDGAGAARQLDAIDLRLGGGADDAPLFVALAHAATRSGLGTDPARLVTLTSAVCAAFSVLVVFLIAIRLLDRARLGTSRGRLLFAAAGASSLAVAHGFWLRAVTPSPAALSSLLFALVVWLWVRRLTGGSAANILVAVFLSTLALTVEVGFVVFLPLILVASIWLVWRPQRETEREGRRTTLASALVSTLFAFGLGLLPFLALEVVELARTPYRADFDSEIMAGHSNRVVATASFVGRQALSGHILPITPAASVGDQLQNWAIIHVYNFLLFATVFGVLGALVLLLRRSSIRSGILLIILMAVAVGGVVYLPAPDPIAALPAAIIFAVWVAAGSAVIFRRATPIIAAVLLAFVIVAPVGAYLGAAALMDRRVELQSVAARVDPVEPQPSATALQPWRHSAGSQQVLASEILESVPDGAALIVVEDSPSLVHVIRAVQRVRDMKPSVAVEAAAPEGTIDLSAAIAPAVFEHLGKRAIFVSLAGAEDRAGELLTIAGEVRPTSAPEVFELVRLDPGSVYALAAARGAVVPLRPELAPDLVDEQRMGAWDRYPDVTRSVEAEAALDPQTAAALGEADSLFAAGAYWQAAAMYGTVVRGESFAPPGSATARTPVPAETYARYTVALAQSGMPRMSDQMRARTFAATGDSTEASAKLGKLFLDAGNARAARELLEIATQRRPADTESLYALGRACQALGDLDAARSAYRRYLTLGGIEHFDEVNDRIESIIETQAVRGLEP